MNAGEKKKKSKERKLEIEKQTDNITEYKERNTMTHITDVIKLNVNEALVGVYS